jgi:hypothetical protein
MAKKPMDDSEVASVVDLLGMEYREDLAKLKNMNLRIVDEIEFIDIKNIALKYNFGKEITKDNVRGMVGLVGAVILKRFEQLAIEHILERVREESSDRVGKKSKVEKTHTEYEGF